MEPELLYKGDYLQLLRKDDWEYAERLNCSGVVFIIAITDDEKIVLIEQFRVPVGKRLIEIPAGIAGDDHHAGETNETAAKRELVEETGYEAKVLVPLVTGPVAPGSSSMVMTFYLAQGLKKIGQGGGDHTEDIKVHEVPLSEVDEWLKNKHGDDLWVDPRVFIALYLLRHRMPKDR
ncbi:MAG: NUDIX hydrolase [Candidatus Omnitrophota bacterium]|nr:NUDIX hydrolase [Candidatus Omnitrophota bacterium]